MEQVVALNSAEHLVFSELFFPLFPILAEPEIISSKCRGQELKDGKRDPAGIHLFKNLANCLFGCGLEHFDQGNLVLLEPLNNILHEVIPDLKTLRDLLGGYL